MVHAANFTKLRHEATRDADIGYYVQKPKTSVVPEPDPGLWGRPTLSSLPATHTRGQWG